LIAFQFRLPKFTDGATLHQNFWELLHSAPNVIAFIFSFAFISVFWINHHQLFHSLKEVNNQLLWLNLHLLFWIAMIPFPITMVGDHPQVAVAAMSLGVVLMMCSLAAFLVRRYSYFKAKLVDETLSKDSINDGMIKNIIAIVLNIIAILTAPISVYIAYGIYVIVLSLFIIPQKLEKRTRGSN
jgi:uncharacterized membrane protein